MCLSKAEFHVGFVKLIPSLWVAVDDIRCVRIDLSEKLHLCYVVGLKSEERGIEVEASLGEQAEGWMDAILLRYETEWDINQSRLGKKPQNEINAERMRLETWKNTEIKKLREIVLGACNRVVEQFLEQLFLHKRADHMKYS